MRKYTTLNSWPQMGIWYVYILLLCSSPPIAHSTKISERIFTKGTSCNVQDKLTNGCMVLTPHGAVSNLHCAGLCSTDQQCLGFTRSLDSLCYLQFNCPTVMDTRPNCSSHDLQYQFFIRGCLYGGVMMANRGRCRCVDGYVGIWCDRYPVNCLEVKEAGYSEISMDVFYLQPPAVSTPFPTFCTATGIDVITSVLSARKRLILDHGFSFNRGWTDYVNGFFSPADNSPDGWIGLEALHYHTTVASLHLLIMTVVTQAWDFRLQFEYSGVVIGNASTNYQLTFDSFTVNMGGGLSVTVESCLPAGQAIPFSAPDKDNDNEPSKHCALEAGAGWWFDTCTPEPKCNPLGRPYRSPFEPARPDGLSFQGFDTRFFAAQITQVRIHLE